jgi:hypothetical protein
MNAGRVKTFLGLQNTHKRFLDAHVRLLTEFAGRCSRMSQNQIDET